MLIKRTAYKAIIFLSFFFLVILQINAQTRISSPYSRFGLGDIIYNKYRPNSGMGGLSIAYRNSGYINYLNPASYTAFDSASFVFQTGLQSDFSQLQTADITQKSNYSSLSYFLMGFPVTKWWRSSLGLFPYSNVGYKVAETVVKDNIGHVNYLFDCDGGLKEFYLGNAFRINKNLSLGVNISYMFGSIDRNQSLTITDSLYYFNLLLKERTQTNDFYFNYGLQYTANLKNNLALVTGITFAGSTDIKSKQDIIASRFIGDAAEPTMLDTINNNSNVKGNITIPAYLGFGLMLEKENKWLIGAEIQMQQWSKFKSFGKKDSLNDSWQIAVGGEIIPDYSTISKYWEKIHYRFGLHYASSYLMLNDTRINDMGVSIGFVFPFKRTKTNLSINLDLGQTGTTDKSLIREKYAKISICMNVYERWFFKRRYE